MAEADDITSSFITQGNERYLDIDLSFSLEYYSNYLSAIERFLDQESIAVRERYTGTEESYSNGIYLEALEDFFPDLLRKSFFVAIYSLIEMELNDRCVAMEKNTGLSFGDFSKTHHRAGFIRVARKYLKEVAGVNLPEDIEEWDTLEDYRILRNCLVHSRGH